MKHLVRLSSFLIPCGCVVRFLVQFLLILAAAASLPASFAGQIVSGTAGTASGGARANFSEMAASHSAISLPVSGEPRLMNKLSRGGKSPPVPADLVGSETWFGAVSSMTAGAGGPAAGPGATGSPTASASFPALEDNGTVATPDTQGAVGPNHLMTTLSSQVRIQNRSGGNISTVPLNRFWLSLGKTNVYEPRVVYDPFGQRWIFVAVNDPAGNNPCLLLAISQTSDPTGSWYLYSDTGPGTFVYPEMPAVGFNKDRIVVQTDMYDSLDATFYGTSIFAFNKTNLYAGGSGMRTLFAFHDLPPPDDADNIGSGQIPAVTYDNSLSTNYLLQSYNGNAGGIGYLRIYSITGPLGSEVFNLGDFVFDDVDPNPWDPFAPGDDNFAPQLGSTKKIYLGDDTLNNVVYRNGSLWAAHTIFLPPSDPTYSAVQWWEIEPTGALIYQRGRIEDPFGSVFYAYPSIAVNLNNDVLIGYSRFATNTYPSAYYSFRVDLDPFSTLRDEALLKAGQAPYYSSGGILNEWGLYSATVTDPVNDTDLWTIQEYAAPYVSLTPHWGTWWGRVAPPVNLAVSQTDSPDPAAPGANVTFTVVVTNATTSRISPASGVKLTDQLPAGTGFISASGAPGGCVLLNGVVTCDIGELGVHSAATVTIVVTAAALGTMTNTVTVTGNGDEIDASDNTAIAITTVSSPADLRVIGTGAPDPVTVGSNLTYTVTVTNMGPSTANGIRLTNVMPESVNFVSASASQGTWARAGSIVTFDLNSLAAGGKATLTVIVTPILGGMITNGLVVAASSPDPNLSNNSATVVTRVNTPPGITAPVAQMINEDGNTGSLQFTVSDSETPAASLVVTRSSSYPALVPDVNVVLGGNGTDRTVVVTPLPDQYGQTTITLTVTDADGASASASFLVTVIAVNDPPTLDSIGDVTVLEDAPIQTVNLTGISSGAANEVQALLISAVSSDPAIIPNPTVDYHGPGTIGSLSFTPNPNANGMVTVTVTVDDQQSVNNTTTQSFTVTVVPVNDPPTLDPIGDLAINENAATQIVNLGGISSGASNESDLLSVSVVSSQPSIIPNPTVNYTSLNATGTLTFAPANNATGSVTITVTVQDDGGTANGGKDSATRTFVVAVNAAPPSGGPSLRIVPAEDDQVAISWPASAADYTLCWKYSLSLSGTWNIVTNKPTSVGNRLLVLDRVTADSKFYRLIRPPVLAISREGDNAILSWPSDATGFVLETKDSLSIPSTWMEVPDKPVVAGDKNTVTLNIAGTGALYHLRGP